MCDRNIGVLQTTVAELATVKEHQRQYKPKHAIITMLTYRQLVHILSCHLSGA